MTRTPRKSAVTAAMFRTIIARDDFPWALRQLSEYTTNVVAGTWCLLEKPPATGSHQWDTALAALTCWAADASRQARPAWADKAQPLPAPWAPIESYRSIGAEARDYWLSQTPQSIAAKGIVFADRELVNP